MNHLPVRIAPCPIHQAFFEIRFTSDVSGEIPGLVFSQIRDRYKKQPPPVVTNIPIEIRERDPNLRFLPTTQYSDDAFVLGVGDHVLNLSTPVAAYPGWEAFGKEIYHMLTLLDEQQIITEVERLGLRYINFFPSKNMWAHIRAKVAIDDSPMPTDDLFLRTKTVEGPLECTTQIAHPAYAKTAQVVQLGSTIDLDAFTCEVSDTSPKAMYSLANDLHAMEKRGFYGLLSRDFLATVNPVYDC